VIGLILLGIGTSGKPIEQSNEPLASIKGREFLD
jgi:hypothetical protein